MVRTLVTGGTGFLGRAIVARLARERESVRVLTRDPHYVPRERRVPGVEYVRGDVFEPGALHLAMVECDALINAVQFDGAPFENPRKGLTYERVDGEGTERQIEAAKKAGVQRIIYLSGAGTSAERTEPWFRAKVRAEKAVRESGAAWTIFRPSWVYGRQDRGLNRFLQMARFLPFVPLVGTGNEKIQPIHVEDVARIVHLSLQDSRMHEKVFELGGPEELSMKEIVRTLLRVHRKRRFLLPFPKSLMKAFAMFLQYFPGAPLTPAAVDFVTMEVRADNKEVVSLLGVSLTKLEEGLTRDFSLPDEGENNLDRRAAV